MLIAAKAARDALLVLASLVACLWLMLGALGLAGLGGCLAAVLHRAPTGDGQTVAFFGFLLALALVSIPPVILGWLDRWRGLVLRPSALAMTTIFTSLVIDRIALLAAA